MIRENYLLTNKYLHRSTSEVLDAVKKIAGDHKDYEAIRDSFATAMSASELFIDACYKTMIDKAGSPEAYLEQYFLIDENKKNRLKEKYCE
jgi:protein tyrosine/serine phosphatase